MQASAGGDAPRAGHLPGEDHRQSGQHHPQGPHRAEEQQRPEWPPGAPAQLHHTSEAGLAAGGSDADKARRDRAVVIQTRASGAARDPGTPARREQSVQRGRVSREPGAQLGCLQCGAVVISRAMTSPPAKAVEEPWALLPHVHLASDVALQSHEGSWRPPALSPHTSLIHAAA